MPATQTETRWTLVFLPARGRHLRPIVNAPVGTWREAFDAAERLIASGHLRADEQIWYVPTQDSQQIEEDRDNVLVSDTRRVPIRWDARPIDLGIEAPAATDPEFYVFDEADPYRPVPRYDEPRTITAVVAGRDRYGSPLPRRTFKIDRMPELWSNGRARIFAEQQISSRVAGTHFAPCVVLADSIAVVGSIPESPNPDSIGAGWPEQSS